MFIGHGPHASDRAAGECLVSVRRLESHPPHSPFYSKCVDNTGDLGLVTVSYSKKNPSAERTWFMPSVPAPGDPGRDEDPAWLDRDPMTAAEREARLDWLCEQDDDPRDDPEEYWDPESCAPPPWQDELTGAELAGVCQAASDDLLAVEAATTGRRGPGQPGSARVFPAESCSPAAAFGPGMALDVLPGCAGLAVAADAAAGGDSFADVSEGELVGLVCAWDRVEAHAAARKLAAMAELGRRNPRPEDAEFTADEIANALGESRARAYELIDTADDLHTRLPGTRAALLDGTVSLYKARLIAAATALLDPAEARAAEAEVLDRAGRLTPGGLRAAIARAVIEVAPEKARQRRETAAKFARVERWAEDSGNAALMGRELPPDVVLACDQRIRWWAGELGKAGLAGGVDELRARALLDLLLDKDSRPRPAGVAAPAAGPAGPAGAPTGGGFAGQVTLTVPVGTAAGRADRPGELAGLGPVDPWLARDLLAAAAQNPKTTWCVTVTDQHGHAVGHGCARPEPKSHRKRAGPGNRGGPEFTFTPASRDGPPGGYGTWRLHTAGPGPDLIITLDPLATGDCDHRYESRGHHPGVKLRHLVQVRNATCTSPVCRRPAAQCDFEHNIPYEAGGRTCLCNGGPKCRHDHRLKQDRRWKVDQLPDATFRWTTPSGRQYTTEPTRYPI